MKPLTIVISFDVSEQIMPCSIPVWIASLVHEFGFDRAKAAFHRGIVPTISLPAHGLDHPGCIEDLAVIGSGRGRPSVCQAANPSLSSSPWMRGAPHSAPGRLAAPAYQSADRCLSRPPGNWRLSSDYRNDRSGLTTAFGVGWPWSVPQSSSPPACSHASPSQQSF